MPTYKAPRHGVTLSEALHEAATVSPIETVMLHTFELWHSSLADPIYVVNNFEALLATKEATADRDAGLEVEFLACGVSIDRPDESDAAPTPEVSLAVSNVSGVISDALRAARGSLDPWEIIERIFASNDTTGPAQTPMRLLVVGIDVTPEQVTFRCSYGDPANVAFPRTTFKRSEYPGLVR